MKVSPILLKTLAHTLETEGHDSRDVLRRCAFDSVEAIDEHGEWVPIERLDEMMAVAVEVTQDPCFGLIAGKSLAQMRFGLMASIAMFSPSLRQMLRDIARYAPLVVERCEFELVDNGRTARVVVDPLVRDGRSGNFRLDSVLTNLLQMLRYADALASDIYEVNLPFVAADDRRPRYLAAFGSAVRFGCPECSVVFDPRLLDRPLANHDPAALLNARTRAESVIAARAARNDIAEKVRIRMLQNPADPPGVLEMASSLGISPRTLSRQLTQLGTSHGELQRECRQAVAQRLLAEGRLPLKQIARAVGFSSVTSLHRAFRTWTGLTPRAWQEQSLAQGPQGPSVCA